MNKHTLQSAQSIHACNYHLLISLSSPTFPAQPHSEQLHSTLDPPETSSLGDSANHQPAYWEEGRHHQMASPGKIRAERFPASELRYRCVFSCMLTTTLMPSFSNGALS